MNHVFLRDAPRLCGSALHFYCTREKNVIFQMYVLMKIYFKFTQSFVQCVEAVGGVGRSDVARGQFSDLLY
jgi:hypothetical protein